MKNFLFFLLGFVLVFAVALQCYAEDGYPGLCQQFFFVKNNTVYPSSCNNDVVDSVTLSSTSSGQTFTTNSKTSVCSGGSWQNVIVFGTFWDATLKRWVFNLNVGLVQVKNFEVLTSKGAIQASSSTTDAFLAAKSGCDSNCQDSDSDGLCDVCDDAPNDSTVGATKYIKGYLQTKNGDTVATYLSHSATSEKYDILAIDPQYNYPDKFPGLVYVIGMPSYIDEKEFQKGGGTIAYLAKPKAWRKYKCNSVESIDQCTKAVCSYDKESGATEADNKLKDTLDGGVKNLSTADQKAADAPYMDLDKNCDQLRTQCNKSCGAGTNVKSFGCSENKHMVCECLNDGKWELAETWDDLGTTINQSETTTNNYYGDGDSTTGGGGVTGVSGAGTGGFTGSYEYVEGSYNYDSFGSHYARLATKFPFSLRTTIGSIYSDFKGNGSAPVYSYTIYGRSVTIDLSSFDEIAKMVRSFFALGITLSTIVMLIYLYVGIDLRGK